MLGWNPSPVTSRTDPPPGPGGGPRWHAQGDSPICCLSVSQARSAAGEEGRRSAEQSGPPCVLRGGGALCQPGCQPLLFPLPPGLPAAALRLPGSRSSISDVVHPIGAVLGQKSGHFS
ncbi:hypothetical protein NDU88_012333 [Pleurodeles waltl]|uniref:Uncharacterized protein n=1 Tax=Pleurodeles waltl TaxID=8319 RepID=A0AAV7R426_PLEWA|nr:hypothetical protein NDU88_012333 [Pleurodeles waltl]